MWNRRTLAGFAGLTMAVAVTACGASEPGATPDDGDPGLDEVTIGLIPVIDVAPLYLGLEQGIFEEHGIDLDIQLAQGGAAIVPAVVSGEYEFGFSNTISLLVARERDIPIKVIANGSRSTNVPGQDAVDVAVPDDSDIERPRDLAGARVAINALDNFGDITIRHSVELDGGDPDAIEFVEVPYPNMPAQLAAGEVDAAWTGEPFRTQILDEGARVVASPLTDLADDVDVAYYFTSEDVLERDPELVERFAAALRAAFDYAEYHEDQTRQAISGYAQLPEGIAERVVLTAWPADINRDGLRVLAGKALEYGVLTEEPDLDALIHE